VQPVQGAGGPFAGAAQPGRHFGGVGGVPGQQRPVETRTVTYRNDGTTYKTPDGGVYYSLGHQRSDPRTYRPGRTVRETWNHPAVGPSLPADGQFLTRTGDRIAPAFSLWGGSDPRHHIWNDRAMTRASAKLYRDGELVGELTRPWADEVNFDNFTNFWTVPAGPAAYRLDVTASRNLQWHGPCSQQIAASWTFRSGHTDTSRPVPLTVVRFQRRGDLDARTGVRPRQ
jgi:hypothetical protein